MSLSRGKRSTPMSYLKEKMKDDIRLFFDDPWSCQVIFESLHPLAQVYVSRLLCVAEGLDEKVIENWCLSKGSHKVAWKAIRDLRLMDTEDRGAMKYYLHRTFKENLQSALCRNDMPWKPRDFLKMDQKSEEKWNAILGCMVDPSNCKTPSGADSADLLRKTGLMKVSSYDLTPQGYEFILLGRHMQAWRFLRVMLDRQETVEKRVRLLKFVFRLRFCEEGTGFCVKDIGNELRKELEHFYLLGFGVLKPSESEKDTFYFYPSRLSIDIMSRKQRPISQNIGVVATPGRDMKPSSTTADVLSSSPVSIIVESNFNVYAYTTSPLHIRMLSFFVDMRTKMPNLVHGVMTRDSIGSAMVRGIRANQIREYLEMHAHPLCRQKAPVIPSNVIDQIFMWEEDESRVTFEKAVHFEFADKTSFETWMKQRQNRNRFILWKGKALSTNPKYPYSVIAREIAGVSERGKGGRGRGGAKQKKGWRGY
eukprot:g2732.t1